MAKGINLYAQIEKQLPNELVNFMQSSGQIAASQGQNLYLVGGVVRDLLLGKANFDLDLVIEGDAINLAQQLYQPRVMKLATHPHFGTAKLQWDRWSVDLTTARSETYPQPGVLPRVKPSSIESDLFRRDFTINAMAISLNPDHYGELVDLYHSRDDIEHKLIRILHKKSFIDDATRIWRALRYEQRLDFQLEAETRNLLQRDITMLETISGDRIRYELECIFKESLPEKVLRRAEELNILARLQPSLRGDGWLTEKFQKARQISSPDLPSIALYLSLWFYHLNSAEIEGLIYYLRLSKRVAQPISDTIKLNARLDSLSDPKLKPSRVYQLLHGYSPVAITANWLASESAAPHHHLKLFLDKVRYVKPALSGSDLLKMGITPGPEMKEIMDRLHEARLDSKISSKQGEIELVKQWQKGVSSPPA